MLVTYFVALSFTRPRLDDESLAPGQPMECPSENVAIRRAEALSRVTGNIGAVAFKRTGYPSTGDFKPAEIIKTFGEVPDDLSEL